MFFHLLFISFGIRRQDGTGKLNKGVNCFQFNVFLVVQHRGMKAYLCCYGLIRFVICKKSLSIKSLNPLHHVYTHLYALYSHYEKHIKLKSIHCLIKIYYTHDWEANRAQFNLEKTASCSQAVLVLFCSPWTVNILF